MQKNLPGSVSDAVAATWFASLLVTGETAGTDLPTDTYLGEVNDGQALAQCWLTPVSGGLTAATATAVTFTVSKKTADGSDVTIATCVTSLATAGGTGNWTQYVPLQMTLAANAYVSAQDVLVVNTTHASTGTTFPSFQISLVPLRA